MFIVVKIFVSALVIALVTEVSRRIPAYGGIIAALPLVSLLSIIWLSVQGEQTEALSKFALGVLWGLPATILMLFIIYFSLKNSVPLLLSIGIGIGGWLIFLVIQDAMFHFIKT